ncbi:MAG: hypothetical protein IT484_02175 [Gammaproteobacteria bacterium]|nr:hypothetical protein [Gammaproteobacteria bacterium]
MATAVELLRRERQRKMQVRESFNAGLAHFRGQGGEPGPFYLACADYLVHGQQRLIDQDRRLVDILAPRVPAAQAEDHRAMQALRERLDIGAKSLGEFQQATGRYRQAGQSGRADFEAAAIRFIDVLVNVLGARSHSLRHLTSTLLTDADWQRIVATTEEFIDAEAAAFAAIGRLAPPGLAPEQMAAGVAQPRQGS